MLLAVTLFALFIVAHCAHETPEATSACQSRRNGSSVNNGKPFNLMLVEQHPATVCSVSNISLHPKCNASEVCHAPDWTISYLWLPSTCAKQTAPAQCPGLSRAEMSMLRHLWPTLLPDSIDPEQWWVNEIWNFLGVGRCIQALAPGVFTNCSQYFSQACTLYNRTNITKNLNNADITPSSDHSYGFSEIQKAFDTRVILGCQHMVDSKHCALSRIGVCFTCVQPSPGCVPQCSPIDCEIPLPKSGAVLPWNKLTAGLKQYGFNTDFNCAVPWCNRTYYRPKDSCFGP